MQMHRLIFNAHNKGVIPETRTAKGHCERYPDYPGEVHLGQRDHASAHTKSTACDGRGLSGSTVVSLGRLGHVGRRGTCGMGAQARTKKGTGEHGQQ